MRFVSIEIEIAVLLFILLRAQIVFSIAVGFLVLIMTAIPMVFVVMVVSFRWEYYFWYFRSGAHANISMRRYWWPVFILGVIVGCTEYTVRWKRWRNVIFDAFTNKKKLSQPPQPAKNNETYPFLFLSLLL